MADEKNNIFTFPELSPTGIHWFTPSIGIIIAPTNIGVIAVDSDSQSNSKLDSNSNSNNCKSRATKKDIYLIDSGANKEAADHIYECLKRQFDDFTIKAVIDTHSHADHCGGNAELVKLSGCKIYSTLMEKSGIECPLNQSAVAYGGAPLPEYKSGYYLAQSSTVDRVIKSDEIFSLENQTTIKCVPLPGHYFEMIGVLCTQKFFDENNEQKEISVFFTSDGIFTRGMLSRYWIPFLFDVGQFKESLAVIKSTKADFYIPSHGDIYKEVSALYELNMISCLQNEESILNCVKENPATYEDILKYIADLNEIPMRLSQFMLVGSTVRSYITHLYEQKKITWVFRENKMYWKISNS